MRRHKATKVLGTIVALAGAMWLVPQHAEASVNTATLRVSNGSVRPLTVFVNGVHRGVAPAGKTYSFFGVPAGMTTLVLKDAAGRARSTGRFFLAPASARMWTVNGPRPKYASAHYARFGYAVASVQVRHHLPEAAHIYLGARYCGRTAPGGVVNCTNIRRGTQMLVAKSVVSPYPVMARRPVLVGAVSYVALTPPQAATAMPVAMAPMPMAPAIAPYPDGMVPTAVLPAAGTLRVINRGYEVLNLVIGGRPLGSIAPGGVRDLGVAPGAVRVLAANGAGQLRGDAQLIIYSGRVQVWQVVYGANPNQYAMIPNM